MKLNRVIFIIIVFLAALLAGGCGDESTGETTVASNTTPTIPAPAPVQTVPQCDPIAPSIMPEPDGRPRHVYFFRDT